MMNTYLKRHIAFHVIPRTKFLSVCTRAYYSNAMFKDAVRSVVRGLDAADEQGEGAVPVALHSYARRTR